MTCGKLTGTPVHEFTHQTMIYHGSVLKMTWSQKLKVNGPWNRGQGQMAYNRIARTDNDLTINQIWRILAWK